MHGRKLQTCLIIVNIVLVIHYIYTVLVLKNVLSDNVISPLVSGQKNQNYTAEDGEGSVRQDIDQLQMANNVENNFKMPWADPIGAGEADSKDQLKLCKKLPDAIVLGVKKCGTITLETFLNYHPNVAATGEIPFFENDSKYKQGIVSFLQKMPNSRPDQITISKSPAVWYQEDVLKVLRRHKEHLPNVKMLMIVKDPIVRLVSDIVHYNSQLTKYPKMQYNNVDDVVLGNIETRKYYPGQKLTVRQAVYHLSNYSRIWKELTTVYPENQILLLDGDVFIEEPVRILNKIEDFLNLPRFFSEDHFDFSGKHGFPCFKLDENSMSKCMSKSKARDHPDLSEESLQHLRNHFKPMLEEFKNQTGMTVRLS